MANNWLKILLRIPVIFALDFSLSFLYDYLKLPWCISLAVQGICILAWLLVLVSSYQQLLSIYYFGMFLFHLTIVLYFNVWKSPLVIETNSSSILDIFKSSSPYFPLQPVVISWIVYIFSIVVYALAFRSIKPVLMALSLIPLFMKHLEKKYREATFIDSIAFGIVVFISLQTLHNLCIQFITLIRYQIRVITFRFRMYGALVLFVLHWRRLHLNAVLSLYWVIFWNYHMVVFTIFVDEKFHPVFILACASYTCNSFIKIAALCYVLQHVVKMLLNGVRQLVSNDHTVLDEGHNRPSGLRESVGFLVLSLYTNLTTINPSKRIVLFELILLLLLSALIRSVFEVVEPYLLSLNSTIVSSSRRHIQLVSMCVGLMCMAAYMGLHLYRLREKVPFSIPNIITVAQILSGLILYLLYMYDSHRGGSWEALDDYVYYIKGTCRTFEFTLIVLVLGYRVLDTSSKWTVFQVIMVVLHLYVNVYLSLKDGYRSVKLRRLVNQKLNVLPHATDERLAATSDVCPICLDELKSARVTPCNHLFHMFCLKKWLNVQNKCPMCHATILDTGS